ncbi:M48 family metalloprotease [Streptomyces sp. NPDC057307]|uniref:M48 family metalloprotease n=1 Tax=Streptomyces sp. NPDC057307 TaxID=3346096 RepID=UPI00363FA8B4
MTASEPRYPADRPYPERGTGPRAAHDGNPDTLGLHEGRVHITARHRGIDVTTIGHLALHIPNVLLSLVIVTGLSLVLAELTSLSPWMWVGLWSASGALAFLRPVENLLARLIFGLHHPTPDELAKLRPIWREVTARAGVDAAGYTLWIEESADINAAAPGGHIVSVTRHAVERLPDGQLAAVLAHELGHHVGGHAWSTLMTYWYSLPGRLAWRLLLMGILMARRRSPIVGEAIVLTLAAAAFVSVVLTNGLVLLFVTGPFLISAVARSSELRADRYASGLGLTSQLTALFSGPLAEEPAGKETGGAALLARLLASHPDSRARLHALNRHTGDRQ